MSERDELIDRVADALRAPVAASQQAKQRVMAGVRGTRRPRRLSAAWRWLVQPKPLMISPLTGAAFAAGVAALLLIWPERRPRAEAPRIDISAGGITGAVAELGDGTAGEHRAVQFIVVVPSASQVSLVGDFNDWDVAATPLTQRTGDLWTVVMPLSPGHHRYAFVVDGSRWVALPEAPRAPDDDFGAPSSIVMVGGQTT